jgi:hypothetical protein
MGTDKVHFQTNVPAEVALKYGDGKDVAGQYGDQVLYTLTDGRVMYVPPIVRKQIQDFSCRYTGCNENFVPVASVQAATLRPIACMSVSRSSEMRW